MKETKELPPVPLPPPEMRAADYSEGLNDGELEFVPMNERENYSRYKQEHPELALFMLEHFKNLKEIDFHPRKIQVTEGEHIIIQQLNEIVAHLEKLKNV